MQAYEQKMRACTGKGKCQNGQRSVHRELADFPDSGTPCRQFGVQEQPHDALVQDQVLLHMRAGRKNSFEKDPDRCFYHICPAPNAFPLLSKVYRSSLLILVAQTLPSQVRLLCLAQIEQQGTKKPLDCHLKIPIYKMHICAGPASQNPNFPLCLWKQPWSVHKLGAG